MKLVIAEKPSDGAADDGDRCAKENVRGVL